MAGPAGYGDQCPARGPGLAHGHSAECAQDHLDKDGKRLHNNTQCCDCGVEPTTRPTVKRVDKQEADPGPETHTFDPREEPRAVTGKGPQGRSRGPGRGPLLRDDMRRLEFYVLHVRRDAMEHP